MLSKKQNRFLGKYHVQPENAKLQAIQPPASKRTDGSGLTELCLSVEAPRHEAGLRVIFGPQNDALQMGYGAGNIDRPASPKVPKNEARKLFFFRKLHCA